LQQKWVIELLGGAQVDSFRFDIMGHLMVPTMRKIQDALSELTLERDGVDGRGIYIYGEAWDFGEVWDTCYARLLACLTAAPFLVKGCEGRKPTNFASQLSATW
jgi:hypothetical protein